MEENLSNSLIYEIFLYQQVSAGPTQLVGPAETYLHIAHTEWRALTLTTLEGCAGPLAEVVGAVTPEAVCGGGAESAVLWTRLTRLQCGVKMSVRARGNTLPTI